MSDPDFLETVYTPRDLIDALTTAAPAALADAMIDPCAGTLGFAMDAERLADRANSEDPKHD